jgi:hypothetical protein
MAEGLNPTEKYDSRVSVHFLDDDAGKKKVRCSSYREAVDLVKERQHEVTVAKIVDKDGDVVFSSQEMDIDTWESIWQNEKRRLSVDVEEHHCQYDSISCFADDLCVQCKMDKLQNRS